MDPDCELCNGTGEVPLDRCPFAVTTRESLKACAYAELLSVGVLPTSGGFEDQSATLLDALEQLAPMRDALTRKKQRKGARSGTQ